MAGRRGCGGTGAEEGSGGGEEEGVKPLGGGFVFLVDCLEGFKNRGGVGEGLSSTMEGLNLKKG